jgi:hypothetical protein
MHDPFIGQVRRTGSRRFAVVPQERKKRIMNRLMLTMLIVGCAVGPEPPHREVVDLHDELDDGHVNLTSASGNGSSSGSSITARLVSATPSPLRIDVVLSRPIYLANTGRGQNMIALQVYLSDNSYATDGTDAFITLPGQTATPVVFVAFCMDFEKDNPTALDQFFVAEVPTSVLPVVERINRYAAANPDADIVAAAQAAIWLAQGVTIRAIRSRFNVTPADEALARQFLM